MEQDVKNKAEKQYFKFQNEVALFLADDFDYLRANGIYEHNGKIGANVNYNGFLEVYGRTYVSDMVLTQKIKTKPTKVLCHLNIKCRNGFSLCRVITSEACKDLQSANIKTYEGRSEYTNSDVGILSVEYGKGENPDVFLEKLFKTVEASKNAAMKARASKKKKLNLVTKLTHLMRNNKMQDSGQEM